jgi:hypothetical protein
MRKAGISLLRCRGQGPAEPEADYSGDCDAGRKSARTFRSKPQHVSNPRDVEQVFDRASLAVKLLVLDGMGFAVGSRRDAQGGAVRSQFRGTNHGHSVCQPSRI